MRFGSVPFTPYLLGFASDCITMTASPISTVPSQFASPHKVTPSSAIAEKDAAVNG